MKKGVSKVIISVPVLKASISLDSPVLKFVSTAPLCAKVLEKPKELLTTCVCCNSFCVAFSIAEMPVKSKS